MARRKPQIAKVDENQPGIVDELKTIAELSVVSLAKVANGCPDLIVGFAGRNWLFEVKMPGKGLNEAERAWHQNWKGQVHIITTAREAAWLIVSQMPERERLPPRLLSLALL